MTLLESIRDLQLLNELDTIYAAKPWSADSPVIVTREPEEGGPPAQATAVGLEHFLNVFEARDLLDEWTRGIGGDLTVGVKVARLIGYAEGEA